MSHRMDQIKPAHYVTREECQEMIDDAIRKHNRNAGIISMFVGFFVLGLFSEGLLRLIGVIPPLVPAIHIYRLVGSFYVISFWNNDDHSGSFYISWQTWI